jgi:predicted lipid-binding transport protein (Tim44 family)
MTAHPAAITTGRPAPAPSGLSAPLGVPAGLWVGLLLVMGSNDAGAAVLGGLATSAGLLAALTALVLSQRWAAYLPAAGLLTAGGVLLAAGAAAWLWRAHATQRVPAFAGVGGGAPAGTVLRAPSACRQSATIVLPAGVEHAPLLAELRGHFVRLQAAWDRAEATSLRALTTPELFDQLCLEWPGAGAMCASNRTDVVTLHAELLGFEALAGMQLASVEFSGLIREAPERGAVPFRELWMLARPHSGEAGWKLARHQALL